MIYAFYAFVALAGAGIHLLRHRDDRGPGRVAEVFLLWWIVWTIAIPGIVAAGLHLFDGPGIAAEIGFTRGDGGFQTEVGFADLAIGIAALGCIWFRDRYWLAVIVVATVFLWGDAYGHIYQSVENDNHDPDNTGLVLVADILFPIVAIALYALRDRAIGRGAATPASRPA